MIDPHHPDPSEQRLTDLEIKASYTEDLVDTLNAIVARQQQQIDQLARELVLPRQAERLDQELAGLPLRHGRRHLGLERGRQKGFSDAFPGPPVF